MSDRAALRLDGRTRAAWADLLIACEAHGINSGEYQRALSYFESVSGFSVRVG